MTQTTIVTDDLTHPTAEATVLSGMINGNQETALELSRQLDPSDFDTPHYSVIFEATKHLLEGYEPVDKEAILAESRRVVSERKGCKLVISEAMLDFKEDARRAVPYARTVKRLSMLRKAAGFSRWMLESISQRPEVDQLFTEAVERLQQLRPANAISAFVYGRETFGRYQDLVQAMKSPEPKPRFIWPWQSWNNKVRPLRPGMVGILAAPDGMGKSAFLEEIAEFWAMIGFNVVLVHLEDDLDYKLDRRTSRCAKVEIAKIEDHTCDEEELARIKKAEAEIEGLWGDRLHYFYAPGLSMNEIVRELETRVAEGVCDVVVFDYLDKVQPTRMQAKLFAGDTWGRQADDVEQLKVFAARARIPVMAASQGNKAMQNGGTQTRQNVQGGGGKTQKSQLVIIMTRDIVGPDGMIDADGNRIAEPGEYSPICKMRIDKQNRGQTLDFQQFLVGRYFSISDLHIDRVELN